MDAIKSKFRVLRSTPLPETIRLIFRKAVYRNVLLARYEIRAGSSESPSPHMPYRIEILAEADFDRVADSTPYLTPEDLRDFRRQKSLCIVVWDGNRIAGSSWMTAGEVFVHELHRAVEVTEREHFSCRSYVHPDYRGKSLLSHMIHAYSQRVNQEDLVWGLVYEWNLASIRSLEKLGWRHTGDYWTKFVFGRKVPGERHFSPRPPTSVSRPS